MKFTPLTTRPLATSRQGMTRVRTVMSRRRLRHGQRGLQVQPPVIERPAGDHAFDTFIGMQAEDADVRDARDAAAGDHRSEEHTSELQSLMRSSYDVFCLKKKKRNDINNV